MAQSPNKRKADSSHPDQTNKKQKYWQTPKQSQHAREREIHVGDVGIWVTCARGREHQCATEVVDLLNEYASKFYENAVSSTEPVENTDSDDEAPIDVEKAILSEISSMKKTKSTGLFKVIRPNIECVLFIRTRKPVDPVELVHSICRDIAAGKVSRNSRYVKRLTPATSTEKAFEKNYDDLAEKILKPVFHGDDVQSKKFAIQFTSRNHKLLTRDEVIKKTAALVGNQHKVDLKKPDLIILIEIYQNICTMAVVNGEYYALKRYNLAELGATTNDQPENKVSTRIKKDTQSTIMQNDEAQLVDQKRKTSSEAGAG